MCTSQERSHIGIGSRARIFIKKNCGSSLLLYELMFKIRYLEKNLIVHKQHFHSLSMVMGRLQHQRVTWLRTKIYIELPGRQCKIFTSHTAASAVYMDALNIILEITI